MLRQREARQLDSRAIKVGDQAFGQALLQAPLPDTLLAAEEATRLIHRRIIHVGRSQVAVAVVVAGVEARPVRRVHATRVRDSEARRDVSVDALYDLHDYSRHRPQVGSFLPTDAVLPNLPNLLRGEKSTFVSAVCCKE